MVEADKNPKRQPVEELEKTTKADTLVEEEKKEECSQVEYPE